MNEPTHQKERRSERRRAPAERIAWTRQNATRIHTGWVRDLAPSGMAFVTPTRDQPAAGEAIELTFGPAGPTPQHRWVRVVRTSPYDRLFSVVGCTDERPPTC